MLSDFTKNTLSVHLIGSPFVEWNGEPLSIARRSVRAIFYYLAAQTAPVSRARLCLLFWPDIPETNARRNLTRLLTHLRAELPSSDILVPRDGTVFLDQTGVWCDVHEFRKLAAEPDTETIDLEQALGHYRGSFLEGFSLPHCSEFDNWLVQERTNLEILYLNLLSSLIDKNIARQNYQKAIEFAQRYLETDELAEEIHRKLISLYSFSGNRTKALRQYEDCVTILERELGTNPLPETRSLYQAILEGKPQGDPILKKKSSQPYWESNLRLDIPLVGRSQDLKKLRRIFSNVIMGQSEIVLISGESGIGKTRLLHSLITQSQSQALVLFGSGDLGEMSLPYHPIVEALHSIPIVCPAPLSLTWLSEVARLLPEIRSLKPDLPTPLSLKGEEARIRLFEALCRYISTLQQDAGPLLLCLDNLHWFDKTSMNWLIHFCRQYLTKSRQILLVGTYRSEDGQKMEELRGSLSRSGHLQEIRLEGLQTEDIREVLRIILADSPRIEVLAAQLREATGGNPFFILEILRSLKEENWLHADQDQLLELPLPDSVREAVHRRLGRLNSGTRQVLEAGAVLGSRFGFIPIRLTAGRSEMETVKALDELVRRQLLTEDENGFSFSHDLVRRATIAATSNIRLRLLHNRAGRALEKSEPETYNALAYHFDHSGDWEKALQYYQLSVQKAETLFAWQEAHAQYERMLELVERLDPNAHQPDYLRQRSNILSKIIPLLYQQGNLSERDERLEQLDRLAAVSSDQQIALASSILQAHYQHLGGHYLQAIETAEQGLKLAEALKDDTASCRLLSQIGFLYFFLGQPGLAAEKLEAAKNITDTNKDLDLRALVMVRLGFIKYLFGKYREALDCHQEAYACQQQLGNHYAATRYLTEIGDIQASLGRYQESRQSLTEILEFARRSGQQYDEGHTLLAMGWLHVCEGEYETAIPIYKAALAILQPLQNHQLIATVETGLGLAYYQIGNYEHSLEWLTNGLQRARTLKFRFRAAEALILMARVENAMGCIDTARGQLSEGLEMARQSQSNELIVAGLTVAAGFERQAGNYPQAILHANEALSFAQQSDLAGLEMWVRMELSLILQMQDRIEEASEQIQRAILLIPEANQSWIKSQEVLQVHAKVNRRLEEVGVSTKPV